MVVEYFRPYDDYHKGIIKANYINNQTDNIIVEASTCQGGFSNIYPYAILEDTNTYYQTIGLNEYPDVNITFEKTIFISHFALKSGSAGWMYPKNWTFKGCINDKCRLLANSSDPEYFNQSGMRLTTVKPGVFNKFSFQAENNKEGNSTFYTIRRIELFGYTCDTEYECNGNLLLKTNCNNQDSYFSHQYLLYTAILLYSKK